MEKDGIRKPRGWPDYGFPRKLSQSNLQLWNYVFKNFSSPLYDDISFDLEVSLQVFFGPRSIIDGANYNPVN